MSEYKNKSDGSFKAASILLGYKDLYSASSVHCSYYSCLQLMSHFVYDIMGLKEQQLVSELRSLNNKKDKETSSHEFLINKIKQQIPAQSNDYRDFQNEIMQLKKMRNIADYSNEKIDYLYGDKAFAKARFIHNILNKTIFK